MKRGKGGDSIEALREIWRQGYVEGRRIGFLEGREMRPEPAVVDVDPADIARVYEPGACAHPEACPCAGGSAPPGEPQRHL